ncbi:ArsR/SmtB family transcription factor [Corynebacterium sp. 335C]
MTNTPQQPGDEVHPAGEPVREFAAPDPRRLESAASLLACLAAPRRLAIVSLLAEGPMCVHELVDAMDANQPLVSQHLRVLKRAGVVDVRRRGRESVYSLADGPALALLDVVGLAPAGAAVV